MNRPGEFELTDGLTVAALIRKADGLREDVFLDKAVLTRVYEDQHKETISFKLTDVLQGGPKDVVLRKNDEVLIASYSAFQTDYTITIEGEVRNPGTYPYRDNSSLKDLLFLAGGLTDAGAEYRVDLSRRVTDNGGITSDTLAQILTISTDKGFVNEGEKILLQPFDQLVIRKKPNYSTQKKISIEGEVLFPGAYTIQRKDERISDVLKRAGGLTSYAYPEGAFLIRSDVNNTSRQPDYLDNTRMFVNDLRDSSGMLKSTLIQQNRRIPVNVHKVLLHPEYYENYIVEEGDSISIPKVDPLVKINGEVLVATKTNYIEGESLGYYLDKAGGVTDKARLSKIYILYSNGKVARTHTTLFGLVKKFPEIKPGSEIIVTSKADRRKLTAAETVGISASLLSVVSLILVTLNSLK